MSTGHDDDLLRAADPLGADAACHRLRQMNARGDVDALVRTLRAVLPDDSHLRQYSPLDCLAAMRDLGLFLGSIKRHGVEPVVAVPEVEPVLTELGARTDMVPRDTAFHYLLWNPTGARQRMYTGEAMEDALMSATRLSLHHLPAAVGLCDRLRALEPNDAEFASCAEALAVRLGYMENSIDIVQRRVSPEFFARTMRPYFEDIIVANARYLGPAAAHVPLSLVDLALWASDRSDTHHTEFWRESAVYSLPWWRPLYGAWEKTPSLVTRVISALELVPGEAQAALRAAAESLCRCLRALLVFRGRHIRVARQAYAETVRLYPVGSGGGSVDLLAEVMALTRDNAAHVQRSLRQKSLGKQPPGQSRLPPTAAARQFDQER